MVLYLGLARIKIRLISSGFPWLSILTVQNRGLKHHSFHFHFLLGVLGMFNSGFDSYEKDPDKYADTGSEIHSDQRTYR